MYLNYMNLVLRNLRARNQIAKRVVARDSPSDKPGKGTGLEIRPAPHSPRGLSRAQGYCFLFTSCAPVSVMLSSSAWTVNTAPPISPPDSATLVWPLFGATPAW